MKTPTYPQSTSFCFYLKTKAFTPRSIHEYEMEIARFYRWSVQHNHANFISMNYQEILDYVSYLRSKGLNAATLKNRVINLKAYFDHLSDLGIIERNPIKQLNIRGLLKKIVERPLSQEELEKLYLNYMKYRSDLPNARNLLASTNRNLAILGFMIWQGLHSGEIARLEVNQINLPAMSIYVAPSHRKSKGRILALNTNQLIPLQNYIDLLPIGQIMLFDHPLNNVITWLFSELKGLNPLLRNALHIRSSVMLNWLKAYDLRQVQYMVGHKWISSTERYAVQETDSLAEALARYHPFK